MTTERTEEMDALAREILSRHCEYMNGLERGQVTMKTSNALAAVKEALNTRSLTPQAGDGVVERVARAMKTWTFAKSPCLDGYRICGVVDEGDRTSFPSKTFKTIAEAQAALDDLNVRAVLAALPPAGRVEELEKALEPFAAAAQLFTSGVHNGGFENVQAFPTAQEWRIAGSLFPEYQGMTSFPKAEALRAALGSHNG